LSASAVFQPPENFPQRKYLHQLGLPCGSRRD
jgi:hypothetical protein